MNAELAAAEAEFNQAEAVYQRLPGMEDKNVISQDSLQKARSAVDVSRANLEVKKGQLARTRILAPWDGVMGASDIQPGECVTPSTKLGILYDLSAFKVQFNVAAEYTHQLRTGQTVQVRIEAQPTELLKGEIYFVAPIIDETTRTIQVKAKLTKPNHRLLPGMYATAMLALPPKDEKDPVAAKPPN